MKCRALFFCVALAIGAPTARAQSVRFALPDDVFYFRPASAVFGAEALWCNPAALNEYKTKSLQLIGELRDGHTAKSWGVVSNERSFALAYRNVFFENEKKLKQFVGGFGLPFGKRGAFGASYGKVTSGPAQFDGKEMWALGMLARTGENLSLAAVASNLNRTKVNSIKSEIEWQLSASTRTQTGKLTLSASALFTSNISNEKPHWIFTGDFVAAKGITLTASIESNRSWHIGGRFNLEHYFLGGFTRFFRNGDSRGSTVYAGWSEKRQETIMPTKPKRMVHRMQGHAEENPVQPIFGRKRMPFFIQLHTMYRAANDPSIAELVLGFDGTSFGMAQAQEIRDAIRYFRSRGKYVTCHLHAVGNAAYYAASAADRILMSPHDQLNLTGLRAEITYWAGTLEKLGVEPEILRIGPYKSAAESFTQKRPSDESRQQMDRVLDNLYHQFIGGIAEGRSMTDSMVSGTIDMGPFTTEEAMNAKLVDGEVRWEEIPEKQLLFPRGETSLRAFVTDSIVVDNWSSGDKIAVVVLEGEIMPNKGTMLPMQPDDALTPGLVYKALSDALRDPSVKGVVVRINSPGGFAAAADDIDFLLQKAHREIPMVVSMGNVAASGGYAIAMASETVFANPATVTGSIGIFGGKINTLKLDEKIGLHRELYTRGAHSGMLTLSRPWTEDERGKYFSLLQASYNNFVRRVAEGRKLSTDSVNLLGEGRVWTGSEAASNGLVTTEGGLMEAVSECASLAETSSYSVDIFPRRRSLFSFSPRGILGGLVSQSAKLFGLRGDSNVSEQFLPDGEIMARLPYDIAIE